MTEGVVGLDTYSATARPALAKGFASTVQYLVATQNPSGSWGTLRSSDQQRSPRVLTLLSVNDPAIRYECNFLSYCVDLSDAHNEPRVFVVVASLGGAGRADGPPSGRGDREISRVPVDRLAELGGDRLRRRRLQPEGASAHDLVRRLGVSRHPRLRGDVLERESTVGAFVVMKEKLFGMETVCVWESTCLASRQFRAVGLRHVGAAGS